MKRLLFIDDSFAPKPVDHPVDPIEEAKQSDVLLFLEMLSAQYKIGLLNPDDWERSSEGVQGLSWLKRVATQNQIVFPNGTYSGEPNMFFSAQLAWEYFLRFVAVDRLWSEIDVIIIDVFMPSNPFLERLYGTNVRGIGYCLRNHLKQLVKQKAEVEKRQVILPVMMLANEHTSGAPFDKKGDEGKPKNNEGGLWIWNVTKDFVKKEEKWFMNTLENMAGSRVK